MAGIAEDSTLLLFGMNHRTAPLEVREQMALSESEVRRLLEHARRDAALETAAVLSTCNRTEICALAEGTEPGPDSLLAALAELRPGARQVAPAHWYLYRNRAAVRHLFRVSAGLDSMMVGEPQILGQLKEAYRLYCEGGGSHPVFHKIFHLAFRCGKRVRTETALGQGEVSVASAAVHLAVKIFGSLGDNVALLVGAGKTGELVARYLVDRGIRELLIANRTAARADALAERLSGRTVPFQDLPAALLAADVALFCTESPDYLLTEAALARIMPDRSNRLLFLIDLSVPRNCDPGCARLDNVFLYNLDNLTKLADMNMDRRLEEVQRAEGIVEEVLGEYLAWQRSLIADAVIAAIMKKAEEIRSREVEKHRKRFEDEHWKDLDALTRGIVRKILADPMTNLRAWNEQSDGEAPRLETVRELFRLEPEDGGHDAT